MPTLQWIGKDAVSGHHRTVPYRLLRCEEADSTGDPASGNLLVQGDNLHALKSLLPYYANRVNCVYIDPPYNTGNEGWIYNDNVNSPEIRKWLGSVVGKELEDFTRHDKWLCMMYPRLALLREFLADDGVIFVSIDDEELDNLLQIMHELFGRDRRIAVFTWTRKKKGSNLSKEFRKTTEYVVCFRKGRQKIELFGVPAYAEKQVPLLNRSNGVSVLCFPAGAMRVGSGFADGLYEPRSFGDDRELAVKLLDEIDVKSGIISNGFRIEGRFRWSQPFVDNELNNGSIFTASKTFRVNVARFDQASKFKALSSMISPEDGVGTNEDATDELRDIFPESASVPFNYSKPSSLVKYLAMSACRSKPHAIILDSFAGSGTTGHAVLQMNRTDGGNRRFICIEMDKPIARDVTARRLRRVIEGYTSPQGEAVEPLGGGFRFCTLGRPLFDEFGNIDPDVKFGDLAAHVFFSETGSPLPKRTTGPSPLLGTHEGRAIYLLFNGILGDKRPTGGNVLTSGVLASLPPHPDAAGGPRIVYGEACRLGERTLAAAGVTFRKVPYEIKVG